MARQQRRDQTEEASSDQQTNAVTSTSNGQPAGNDTPAPESGQLRFAREKYAKMEAAQNLCQQHPNDFPLLAQELGKLKFSDYEIAQILEPKGRRNLPGFLNSDIERQKQYINYLSAREKRPESHAAAVEQSQQQREAEGMSI